MASETHVLDRPPEGANADWTIPQGWEAYSAEDHATWDTLYARQMQLLPGRASDAFLRGLDALKLSESGIPDFEELSDRLEALTGWRLVSVAGIVPDDAFFAMLAAKRFPIGNFIRPATSLDYLEEPDCFHDIFGHVPMIAHAPVARLMEALGTLGVAAIAAGLGEEMSRLYWYTIEFGLALEDGEVKVLGAGLASSFGEAHLALEADVPRMRFTLEEAARTPYRNDAFQPHYFVSDSLEATAALLEGLSVERLRAISG